jgi:hypothetical protein
MLHFSFNRPSRIDKYVSGIGRSQKTVSIARRLRERIQLERAFNANVTTQIALDPEMVSFSVDANYLFSEQPTNSDIGRVLASTRVPEGAANGFAFGYGHWQAKHFDPGDRRQEESTSPTLTDSYWLQSW